MMCLFATTATGELNLNVTVEEKVHLFEAVENAVLSPENGFVADFASMYIKSNEITGFNIFIQSVTSARCPTEQPNLHSFCGSQGTVIPYAVFVGTPKNSQLRSFYLNEAVAYDSCASGVSFSSVNLPFYVTGSLDRNNILFDKENVSYFVNKDKDNGKLVFSACIQDMSRLRLNENEYIESEIINITFDKGGA